jgi:hypothetical protein
MNLRQPIKRRTPERAKDERLYNKRVKEWLLDPKNRWCLVSIAMLDAPKDARLLGWRFKKPIRATQCHHSRGRIGKLLLMEEFWKPVSWHGHELINHYPELARRLGLLCEKGQWNTVPRNHV